MVQASAIPARAGCLIPVTVAEGGHTPRGKIAEEDVPGRVGVVVDQVRGPAFERDEATVGSDPAFPADGVRLCPTRTQTHQTGPPRRAIVKEDVLGAVYVTRDEIRSVAVERHVPPVGGNGRIAAPVAALRARGVDAHALGDTGHHVVDEDVLELIRIAGNEVGVVAVEGEVAAVVRDGRGDDPGGTVGPVTLVPGGIHTHPSGFSGDQIAEKNVGNAVGVVEH